VKIQIVNTIQILRDETGAGMFLGVSGAACSGLVFKGVTKQAEKCVL
jgi:hypothetical protein